MKIIKIGLMLITSVCLVGCSNKETITITSETTIEQPTEKSYISGVHDIEVDEDSDPQEMFNKLIEGVDSSGYSLNVSEVIITVPGEYEAFWSDQYDNVVTCKVIVNKVEKPITETTTEVTTENDIVNTETQIQISENSNSSIQTTEQIINTEVTTTEATTTEQQPQGRSISGVHDITKSWADTSWNSSTVLFELQNGVSCTGDVASLNCVSGQATGPGTYTYYWVWSDGLIAATCYLHVTE